MTHSSTSNNGGAGSSSSPFFGPEEEFDCPEEDECEIDWDQMPGFGDDDNDEESGASEGTSTSNAAITTPALEETAAATVTSSPRKQHPQPIQSQRVTLEMGWQVQECLVESSSCSEACSTCQGTGLSVCRFCHGKTFVKFGNDVRSCIICQEKGTEECHTCRGTGAISPWAKTLDDFHSKNETNVSP